MFNRPLARYEDGFSLVEALVAATVLTVGLVSLAQLMILARSGGQAAWVTTAASILAQDQMEQLRTIVWPAEASAGCCDFFDGNAQAIGTSGDAPPGTQYVRRWSIDPLASAAGNAVVLQVWVTAPRSAGEVHLVSVRSRKAGS